MFIRTQIYFNTCIFKSTHQSISPTVPVLADTMGMASFIQWGQEGADRGENREGGKTKPVNSPHWNPSVCDV